MPHVKAPRGLRLKARPTVVLFEQEPDCGWSAAQRSRPRVTSSSASQENINGERTPLIITGGSATIEFDEGQLQGSNGKFGNQDKKSRRVEVTGDGLNFAEDNPNGRVTVKIHYTNP